MPHYNPLLSFFESRFPDRCGPTVPKEVAIAFAPDVGVASISICKD